MTIPNVIKRMHCCLWAGLLIVVSAELSAQTYSKKMSMRTWENDVLVYQKEVLDVLDEKFFNEPCSDMRLGAYLNAYLEQLETIRERLSSMSFLIFRNVASAVGEELVPYSENINCQNFDRWRFIKAHFESKLTFVGSIFALFELGGAM